VDGAVREFGEDGQTWREEEYASGLANGRFAGWFENGQIAYDRMYKDGLAEGLVVEWYRNGQKKAEAQYRAGKLHGMSIVWHEKHLRDNGQTKAAAQYRAGKLHGTRIVWYWDGQKKEEAQYRAGKLHGTRIVWYGNGQKEEEAQYRAGKLHGMQRFWTERWRYMVYLTEQARDQAYKKTWVASFEDGDLSWWPLTIARNNLDSIRTAEKAYHHHWDAFTSAPWTPPNIPRDGPTDFRGGGFAAFQNLGWTAARKVFCRYKVDAKNVDGGRGDDFKAQAECIGNDGKRVHLSSDRGNRAHSGDTEAPLQ